MSNHVDMSGGGGGGGCGGWGEAGILMRFFPRLLLILQFY